MAEAQQLAGLPALRREFRDVHKADSCCNVDYMHTDMQTHTCMYMESRENKISRLFKIFIYSDGSLLSRNKYSICTHFELNGVA